MRKVSLERHYFVLYDGTLTLKKSKMALNSFCDKLFTSFFLMTVVMNIDAKTYTWHVFIREMKNINNYVIIDIT